jgi:hypothetical protein
MAGLCVKPPTMKKLFDMKTIGTAAVLVLLALWLGYYLGYHHGVQQERRAWLATEQTVTVTPASVATDGRVPPKAEDFQRADLLLQSPLRPDLHR